MTSHKILWLLQVSSWLLIFASIPEVLHEKCNSKVQKTELLSTKMNFRKMKGFRKDRHLQMSQESLQQGELQVTKWTLDKQYHCFSVLILFSSELLYSFQII